MKYTITILLVLSCTVKTYCQAPQKSSNSICPGILNISSENWKRDSLGTTGYRTQQFYTLLKCNTAGITKTFLFDKLGKPSIILKAGFGKPWKNHVEYIYYITNADPKGTGDRFEGRFIAFIFNEEETTLEQIQDGDFCG